MSRKKIIVIGGSAAGPKTAAKARRIDQEAEIILIQKDKNMSMASCGYPYYVGGVFDDKNKLICTPTGVLRDGKFFMATKEIDARTETEVIEINREEKKVKSRDLKSGEIEELSYDKLVICTGSTPKMPPIPGSDLVGITPLQSIADAEYLRNIRDEGKIKSAVVVGGGLIGVETCEALRLAGMEISLIELLPHLLTFLDDDLSEIVKKFIISKGIHVYTNNGVAEFMGKDGKLAGVKLQDGTEIPCELAVVAIGVKPNVELARTAGLEIGKTGAIVVNKFMQTSDKSIYAAGDCVEIPDIITGENTYSPMGDLANLEGRVAGENSVTGNKVTFPGTIHTGICKIFEYACGSTGLSERVARELGYENIETVLNAGPDRPGFMGAEPLISKLVVDVETMRILGYQCIGSGDVSKQVATAAMAITGELTINDLSCADLPYAPPFSLAIDHFIVSNHIMQNKIKGRMVGIKPKTVRKKILNGERPFILDARSKDEYNSVHLGVGEVLIPLGTLRDRLNMLPEDKEREIICFCKISLRGYEAALILQANGWKNVKVMEGGIMAWTDL